MHAVTYEQPLNERIRTLLRLEYLFFQMDHSLRGEKTWDSRAAIADLVEILQVFGRGDLKTEVIKELERMGAALGRLAGNPEVDQAKLGPILERTEELIDRLHALPGQPGTELKENEFLSAIRQRTSIPGGTAGFDLPAYHHWLQNPAAARRTALEAWLAPLAGFREAIDLTLGLVREAGQPRREVAGAGFYQQSLDTAVPYQLIRVGLPADADCFAEISGGKHRFTIRMMEPRGDRRPVQSDRDVPFVLACCAL